MFGVKTVQENAARPRLLNEVLIFLELFLFSTNNLFLMLFLIQPLKRTLVCKVILTQLFCELSPETRGNLQNFYRWKHYSIEGFFFKSQENSKICIAVCFHLEWSHEKI